ncbi:MAG: tRNA pseudouridine(13) synthase TruD [Candidatus Thermoplasmatota archaeon]|nr:tRNA pseudouridine(13) synthase TruD [Candidatus Thermoplasmatota archaeon]MCL5791029.1 tRNA pseudouridine(13) synthase TruD [Candidatus Thermoplasmatota archaeon]
MTSYTIKMEPGDFQVYEVSNKIMEDSDGKYTILKIRLTNWETNHFLSELARYIGISRKRITYAGTKDKRAVTTQYFCVNAERIPDRINVRDCEILERFRSSALINLGDLTGNHFSIRVDTGSSADEIREGFEQIIQNGGFWNYFGIQRFGSIRYNTHRVGEKLIKEGFESAVKEYLADPEIDHDQYRIDLLEGWDFQKALKEFPEHLQFERAMMYELVSGKSYKDSFDALPRSLKIMFVHAYQSYIFNQILNERKSRIGNPSQVVCGDIVSPVDQYWNIDENKLIPVDSFNIERIRKLSEEGKVSVLAPLIGTETVKQKGVPGEIMESLMEREGISFNSFEIEEKREMSSTGSYRGIRFIPVDMRITESKILEFTLGKGIYATALLDQIFRGINVET